LPVVIDDRLLLEVLLGEIAPEVAEDLQSSGVYTTSCWYYRLGRALVGGSGQGSLSRRLEVVDPASRLAVTEALTELPEAIGILSARVTVPVMLALRVSRQMNMLSAEALAVALLVSGSILVTTDTPLVRSGAADIGLDYQLLTP
jgi:hypothetical protein